MSFLPFIEQFKIFFFDKAKNRKEFRLIKKAESIDLFKIVASFKWNDGVNYSFFLLKLVNSRRQIAQCIFESRKKRYHVCSERDWKLDKEEAQSNVLKQMKP